MTPILSVAEVNTYLAEVFPQLGGDYACTALGPGTASVQLTAWEKHLRPGGTVSGPTMFALADCGFYMGLIGHIGREALAVTTNASLDFMRKPAPGNMRAEVRILKLGRVLAVGDVLLYSDGVEAPVARASMTYSIPPK